MRINTNVSSLVATEKATNNSAQIYSSLEKLSTGQLVGKASDNASGLAIADKLRTQASSLRQSVSNGNSAVNLLQIGDKWMEEQSRILDVIKVRLVQASTETTSDLGREAIRKDITKMLTQLDLIAVQINFNGQKLLSDDSATGAGIVHTFQIGENANNTISTNAIQANTNGLPPGGINMSSLKAVGANSLSQSVASFYLAVTDDAVGQLSVYRADMGSTQNQVASAIRNLITQGINITAAESIIRDVDYAKESANFSKLNIVSQASSYAMSQAYASQQNVVNLLQ